MGAPSLSIIIPAYDEARRIVPTLLDILSWLKDENISHELIVVDDGSRDATAVLVRELAEREPSVHLLVLPVNTGKGAAVKEGVLTAQGALILMCDADLSTPMSEFKQLEIAIKQGADIAIGSRALDRSRILQRQPFYREAGGRLFNSLVQLLTVQGIEDTQCGFKLFAAAPAKAIFTLQQVSRFGFDVEVLYLARKKNYRIAEISVLWTNCPETKVRPLRDGLRTFLDLGLIRFYDYCGRYAAL